MKFLEGGKFEVGGMHRYATFQADAFGRARGEPTRSLRFLLVVSPVELILPESPPLVQRYAPNASFLLAKAVLRNGSHFASLMSLSGVGE
ncbi:hypothetical protein CSV63_08535 [Sporosarcina sp. P34]|nr:hypothetical protein CSV63_08535 [Sporosarcina sp. P34]